MTLTIVKHLLVSLFFLMLAAISPLQAQAGSWLDKVDQGGLNAIGTSAYDQTGAPEPLQQVVARIIKIFLGVIGVIFVIIIIAAGFKYMTAAGNEEQVKQAVAQIRHGVIGLIIIVAAYAITAFVTAEVFDAVSH